MTGQTLAAGAQRLAANATSPFKFLDAYGAQDSAVFFGRDDEIEALYRQAWS